jgi:hypothetical protein
MAKAGEPSRLFVDPLARSEGKQDKFILFVLVDQAAGLPSNGKPE